MSMRDEIKINDWVRHNYAGLNSIEIFKVGKIEDGKCYKEAESTMSESLDWGYIENCTKMTAQQCVNMDVWNQRIHRGLSNDFSADEKKAQEEYNKHMVTLDGKQWIDLDIEDLPDHFFTRDDIEIEYFNIDYQTWNKVTLEPIERTICIGNPLKVKYRYRIIKKEPMQITRKAIVKYKLPVKEIIGEMPNANPDGGILESVFMLDGREVQIIE